MDEIRTYVLSVVGAAIIGSVLNGLLSKDTCAGKLLHLISGILLTLVAIRPVAQLNIDALGSFSVHNPQEISLAVETGKDLASDAMVVIIKANSEAYILDKATDLNANLTVSVILSEDGDYPVPQSVQMSGSVSPYAKKLLSQMLQEDLGIEPEDQIWN
jgi:hypothetical protein